MANIKELPKLTLISIVKNIKKGLNEGNVLNDLTITKKKNDFIMEYYWNNASKQEGVQDGE